MTVVIAEAKGAQRWFANGKVIGFTQTLRSSWLMRSGNDEMTIAWFASCE